MHYLFDDYTLDTARRELLHVGGVVPLEPKAYQVLVYLMEHRDRLVDKEELLDHIWPELYIHDNAVARCVAALRQALGDSPQRQQIIQTRRGQGYRFVASVVVQADVEPVQTSVSDASHPALALPASPTPASLPVSPATAAPLVTGERRSCPACHHPNPLAAEFCTACGIPFEAPCLHCGQAVAYTATFCPACGQWRATVPSPSVAPGAILPEPPTPAAAQVAEERKRVTVLCGTLALSATASRDVDDFHELVEAVTAMVQQVTAVWGDATRGEC
jgi:DNA-binding winged helix-turn-helix (wHTH) protein